MRFAKASELYLETKETRSAPALLARVFWRPTPMPSKRSTSRATRIHKERVMPAKTALVISGGGSKGAFAVGAIEVLRGHDVKFDLVTGTSTGALIAPLVATDEIPLLRHIYSTVRTPDVLTRRPGVIDILGSDSIYDTSPLWTLINTYITDARYQRILAASAAVELCSVSLQSGEVTYFNPKRGVGGQPMARDAFNRAILASASQPVLMPHALRIGNRRPRPVNSRRGSFIGLLPEGDDDSGRSGPARARRPSDGSPCSLPKIGDSADGSGSRSAARRDWGHLRECRATQSPASADCRATSGHRGEPGG